MTMRTTQVHWADICRVLRIYGKMENFSKAECLRVHALLKQAIADGLAEQVSRGRYRFKQ
jgi:hypothetical protein